MTTILNKETSPWYGMIVERPYAFHALRSDPRVSFTLHAPADFFSNPEGYRLIVAVHGSGRNAAEYRQAFADFADAHRCVVLAPLFPVGIRGDGYSDGYKNLKEGDVRYDQLLLDMVDTIEAIAGHQFGRFYLFGFSGGGQFCQRFYLLHPDRLAAVSIGAPGVVTRIDATRNWWLGTADVQEQFGITVDVEKMARVPAQLVVGDQDTQEFAIPDSFRALFESLENYGRNRVERIEGLRLNLAEHGVDAAVQIVPGVAHEGLKVVPYVLPFFESCLDGKP